MKTLNDLNFCFELFSLLSGARNRALTARRRRKCLLYSIEKSNRVQSKPTIVFVGAENFAEIYAIELFK